MTPYTTRISLIIVTCVLLTWAVAAPNSLTITAPQATVRAGPGVTHPILTMIPQGSIFAIRETQHEWVKILLDDGREGWVVGTVGQVKEEDENRSLGVVGGASSPPTQEPPTPERLALVIGNAAYGTDLGPLRNPLHDAADMAALLEQLGFTVTLVTNTTLQQMQEAIAG